MLSSGSVLGSGIRLKLVDMIGAFMSMLNIESVEQQALYRIAFPVATKHFLSRSNLIDPEKPADGSCTVRLSATEKDKR